MNNQNWYKLKTVQSEEDLKKRRGGQLRLSDIEELKKVCPEERLYLIKMIQAGARIPICKIFNGHIKDLSVFNSVLGNFFFPYLEIFSCFNNQKNFPINHQFLLNNEKIKILYLGGISDSILPDLSSYSELKYLYLHFYGSKSVLTPFGSPPCLEHLIVAQAGLEKLEKLGPFTSLVILDLSKNIFNSIE
ncbi:MAG: hypothetical protein GF353_12095, partial [Candidatus Lokiarchaeota archaeon]|nr:hypothetical protein [Candidatus Lokiarchaeota archaeon]